MHHKCNLPNIVRAPYLAHQEQKHKETSDERGVDENINNQQRQGMKIEKEDKRKEKGVKNGKSEKKDGCREGQEQNVRSSRRK